VGYAGGAREIAKFLSFLCELCGFPEGHRDGAREKKEDY
jgi:hypothetical protein